MTRKRLAFIVQLAAGANFEAAMRTAGYTPKYAMQLYGDESVQRAVVMRRAYMDTLMQQQAAREGKEARTRDIDILRWSALDETQAPRVRAAAVAALGYRAGNARWRGRPDERAETLIRHLAHDKGQHASVREAALRALGRMCQDLPEERQTGRRVKGRETPA